MVAKDDMSVTVIEQKARQKDIEVFPKGHAKNRLYFRCVPEKKGQFLKDIGDLCFWESAVTPPNGILRHYRRNLLKTAVNRLDKKAAQAALKVLTGKSADKNDPVSATQIESEPAKTSLCNNLVASIKPSPKPTILKFVMYGLKNCINRVRFFIKPKRFITTAQR